MKYFISSICLGAIILFLSSCKKDVSTGEMKDVSVGKIINAHPIVGKWELRKVTGLRAAEKNYLPGNGNIWVFSDSRYQIYPNDIPTHSGNYLTGRDFSNATGHITDFLMLSTNEKIYFEIENNILTMYRGELIWDGSIQKYERIPN